MRAWVRLGRTQARMGAPSGHIIAHFRRAVEVSPYDSEAWIALAIQLELDGEPAQAEEHLQKAYGINNGFESRWNLANFYRPLKVGNGVTRTAINLITTATTTAMRTRRRYANVCARVPRTPGPLSPPKRSTE